MVQTIKIGNVSWIHIDSPTKDDMNTLLKEYDFHEIIEEDILEPSTQEKLDVYDNYMFLVIHFPKYNTNTKQYLINEFDIIIAKNYVISISRFKTNHIQKLLTEYQEEVDKQKDKFKITPYYILYRIVDVMYDKTVKMLNKSARDVTQMEDQLFQGTRLNQTLLESLVKKKRNIVLLKHIFAPQEEILEELAKNLPKLYEDELDVYFDDLEYLLDKIQNSTELLFENVESLTDTYNTMMNIKTNTIITILTIFTAITGILTLISGIYGMNIDLPYQVHPQIFDILMGLMLVIVGTLIFIFKKKGWI